jgi:hypothetical protein
MICLINEFLPLLRVQSIYVIYIYVGIKEVR